MAIEALGDVIEAKHAEAQGSLPSVLPSPPLGANGPESWIWWEWVGGHLDDITAALREHIELTLIAVGVGLLIALPLAIASYRWRRLYSVVLAITGVIYTIPSLALFALLVPVTGLSRTTAEIGLIGYTLLILVRNTVTGLDAVPDDVKEAARGMGFSPARQLFGVELPLAVPAIVAGLRIATVTTIGLVTITALIGMGGLGKLILDGLTRDFRTVIVIGCALSVALAVVADGTLLLVQRRVTPWAKARP
jgi:osmoprotectant transport system permease protein